MLRKIIKTEIKRKLNLKITLIRNIFTTYTQDKWDMFLNFTKYFNKYIYKINKFELNKRLATK